MQIGGDRQQDYHQANQTEPLCAAAEMGAENIQKDAMEELDLK